MRCTKISWEGASDLVYSTKWHCNLDMFAKIAPAPTNKLPIGDVAKSPARNSRIALLLSCNIVIKPATIAFDLNYGTAIVKTKVNIHVSCVIIWAVMLPNKLFSVPKFKHQGSLTEILDAA